MARKEKVKFGKLLHNRPDLLLEFVIAENVRITHCPDCMFYSNTKNFKYEATKSNLLKVARKLILNTISIDEKRTGLDFYLIYFLIRPFDTRKQLEDVRNFVPLVALVSNI